METHDSRAGRKTVTRTRGRSRTGPLMTDAPAQHRVRKSGAASGLVEPLADGLDDVDALAGAGALYDEDVDTEAIDREEMVAKAAYYLAEQRGFRPGQELDDWLKAEAQIDGLCP